MEHGMSSHHDVVPTGLHLRRGHLLNIIELTSWCWLVIPPNLIFMRKLVLCTCHCFFTNTVPPIAINQNISSFNSAPKTWKEVLWHFLDNHRLLGFRKSYFSFLLFESDCKKLKVSLMSSIHLVSFFIPIQLCLNKLLPLTTP